MLKITLDANCVVNILDRMSTSGTSVEELAEIIRYALESNVNVAITTRVENDLNNDKDAERRVEMLKRIQMFPVVGTIARLDSSRWDSGDVLAGDGHVAMQNEIQKIVFPGLRREDKRYGNKINDIDHLIGHRINNRDIFVTDDGELLKKADELKASLGIVVMNPQKCVESINARANPAVLVDEFSNKLKKYRDLLIRVVRISPTVEMHEEFTSLREWLMKKYPLLKDGLLGFKLRMVSVPVGNQMAYDQGVLLGLQNANNKIRMLFKESELQGQMDLLSKYMRNTPGSAPIEIEKRVNEHFQWVLDLLVEYSGYFESVTYKP